MSTQPRTTTLEIISDVVCPWCYIGKRRLEQALELMGPEVSLQVCWRPYELNPTMPIDGIERKSYYRKKFGSAQGADQLIANITANAHNDGLAMDYERIVRVPNTRSAHRLIWLAERFDCQDSIVDALFHAYFVAGLDIGNQRELINIAAQTAIESAAVEQLFCGDEGLDLVADQAKAARLSGIQGVPAFVVNGQFLFSGAQSPETISLAIKQAIARQSRQPA